jgi:apolipoprotein N-acyltransferase
MACTLLLSYYTLRINTSNKRIVNTLISFCPIFYWIGFEYLNLNWPFSWPWLTLGNAFGNAPVLVQWYEYTGVLGGSFWILLVNTLIYISWKNFKKKTNTVMYPVLVLLAIVLPVLYSYNIYYSYKEKGEPVKCLLLQPNIDPHTEKFPSGKNFIPIDTQLTLYFEKMPFKKVDTTTRFILLPETSYPLVWDENDMDRYKGLIQIYKFKVENPYTTIVMGLETYKTYGQDPKNATYSSRFSPEKGYYDVFNSSIHIDEGYNATLYRKSKLLYGPEFTPFRPILGFLEPIIVKYGGFGCYGWQNERTVFQNLYGNRTCSVICYESVFGEFVTGFVKNGAEAIFIITNDGWWGDTPGYKQHFNFDRLRAIENRKSIARCANNGISAFINQKGDVVSQTPYWVRTTLEGTVSLNNKKTFYAKHGDYIGRIFAVLTILAICFSIFTVFKNKK